MEIRDWLRALGDRVRVLVIIPLAAALIALLVGLIAPTRYHSTATVVLPEVNAVGPITVAVTQRVADFGAAVKSEAVKEVVAAETGVPVSELDEVTVERSGQSGVLEVGFTGTDPQKVAPVAEAMSRAALRIAAQANLDRAKAQSSAAQDLFDEANDAYLTNAEGTGALYSDDLLETISKQYNDAVDDLNNATSVGDPAKIAAAQAAVDRKFARLNEVQAAQTLYLRRQAATTVLIQANSDVVDAEGDLITADTLAISTTQATAQSKLKDVAQRVIFAAVFGFVLAAGLLVLLVLVEGRGATGEAATESEPAAAMFPRRRAAGRT